MAIIEPVALTNPAALIATARCLGSICYTNVDTVARKGRVIGRGIAKSRDRAADDIDCIDLKWVRGCGDVDMWQICLHIMRTVVVVLPSTSGTESSGVAAADPSKQEQLKALSSFVHTEFLPLTRIACTVVGVSAAGLLTPACTALADVIPSGDAIGIFV